MPYVVDHVHWLRDEQVTCATSCSPSALVMARLTEVPLTAFIEHWPRKMWLMSVPLFTANPDFFPRVYMWGFDGVSRWEDREKGSESRGGSCQGWLRSVPLPELVCDAAGGVAPGAPRCTWLMSSSPNLLLPVALAKQAWRWATHLKPRLPDKVPQWQLIGDVPQGLSVAGCRFLHGLQDLPKPGLWRRS